LEIVTSKHTLFAQLDENSFRLLSKSGPLNIKIYNALGVLEIEGILNYADVISFSESGVYLLFTVLIVTME